MGCCVSKIVHNDSELLEQLLNKTKKSKLDERSSILNKKEDKEISIFYEEKEEDFINILERKFTDFEIIFSFFVLQKILEKNNNEYVCKANEKIFKTEVNVIYRNGKNPLMKIHNPNLEIVYYIQENPSIKKNIFTKYEENITIEFDLDFLLKNRKLNKITIRCEEINTSKSKIVSKNYQEKSFILLTENEKFIKTENEKNIMEEKKKNQKFERLTKIKILEAKKEEEYIKYLEESKKEWKMKLKLIIQKK
jgi:hypothetical protein